MENQSPKNSPESISRSCTGLARQQPINHTDPGDMANLNVQRVRQTPVAQCRPACRADCGRLQGPALELPPGWLPGAERRENVDAVPAAPFAETQRGRMPQPRSEGQRVRIGYSKDCGRNRRKNGSKHENAPPKPVARLSSVLLAFLRRPDGQSKVVLPVNQNSRGGRKSAGVRKWT